MTSPISRGRALAKLALAGAAVAISPLHGRLTGGEATADAAANAPVKRREREAMHPQRLHHRV